MRLEILNAIGRYSQFLNWRHFDDRLVYINIKGLGAVTLNHEFHRAKQFRNSLLSGFTASLIEHGDHTSIRPSNQIRVVLKQIKVCNLRPFRIMKLSIERLAWSLGNLLGAILLRGGLLHKSFTIVMQRAEFCQFYVGII